jgi:hypothetical protein
VKIALHQSFEAPNYAGTQAHGHAQIYGWVGMFIMGVAYFSMPKFMNARLGTVVPAWTAFGLMLTGIVLRAVAQPFAVHPAFGALVLASAVLELAAVMIFVADIGSLLARGKQSRPVYLRFVYTSLAALLALAAWNLALVLPIVYHHTSVVPDLANARFLYLALFGFVVNMILGYSLRLLPIFLGLRPTRRQLVMPAYVLFNAGVLARVFGWPVVSGLLGFAGMGVYISALRIFERSAGLVKARGVDTSFAWFIRLAYAWFVISVAMVLGGDLYSAVSDRAPAHIYIGAWRHGLTVGFITTMMVGLGYRLLPLFTGADLWRPSWMRASFWLLAVGNTTRVTSELATASGQRWAYLVMGSSGVMELTALTLFSISIWKTLSRRQLVLLTREQINPKTRVRWLLDHFPEAREELISAGLRHLEKVIIVPWLVTLEQAASIHGLDVNAIVERLRTALQPPRAA